MKVAPQNILEVYNRNTLLKGMNLPISTKNQDEPVNLPWQEQPQGTEQHPAKEDPTRQTSTVINVLCE